MTAQVFVSGTWSAAKAAAYEGQAVALGQRLAEDQYDLVCGPGTGIARHVIDGYRQRRSRGGVKYYLPLLSEMRAVGEEILPGADQVVQTEFDYPMRNVFQVKQCDGLFVLTGGDGTLEEILPALIDYQMPVAIVRGAGSAALAVERLLDIYEAWRPLVTLGNSVSEIYAEWHGAVQLRASSGAKGSAEP